jgi:ELWxxDGT repeat protein
MKHILHLVFLASIFFSKLNGQNSICQPYLFKNVEPLFLSNSNGNMFFALTGTDAGLWRSDGTLSGTVKINTAPTNVDFSNVAYNGFTYFTKLSPVQLWKTDGTDAGTTMVKEISNANRIRELTATNNKLFFLVEGTNNINKLWKTDGTSNGTSLVLDIDPTNSFSLDPIRMCALNENVFFNAGNQSNGVEIWKSDGTAAGTQIVKEIGPGSQDGTSHLVNSFMGELNGKVYFFGGLTNSGQKGLWQTDGTEQGTNFVKAIGSISKPYHIGNLLYFFAYDEGAVNGSSLYGEELWVTDGTASGTSMVKDIRPGNSGSSTANFSIKGLGSKIVFTQTMVSQAMNLGLVMEVHLVQI